MHVRNSLVMYSILGVLFLNFFGTSNRINDTFFINLLKIELKNKLLTLFILNENSYLVKRNLIVEPLHKMSQIYPQPISLP